MGGSCIRMLRFSAYVGASGARGLNGERMRSRGRLAVGGVGAAGVGLSSPVPLRLRCRRSSRRVRAEPLAGNGQGLDTHLFRPAMDSKGLFTVNGSDILGANDISFGLVIDYGNTLLRVRQHRAGDPAAHRALVPGHARSSTTASLNQLRRRPRRPRRPHDRATRRSANGSARCSRTQWGTDAAQLADPRLPRGAREVAHHARRAGASASRSASQIGGSPTRTPRRRRRRPVGFWYWPQAHRRETLRVAPASFRSPSTAGYRGHSASGTTLSPGNGTYVRREPLHVRRRHRLPHPRAARSRGRDLRDVPARERRRRRRQACERGRRGHQALRRAQLVPDDRRRRAVHRRLRGREHPRRSSASSSSRRLATATATASRTTSTSAPTSRRTSTASRTPTAAPIPDNDNDGIPDVDDRCPNEPEDRDGDQDGTAAPEGERRRPRRRRHPRHEGQVPGRARGPRRLPGRTTAAPTRTTTRTASPTSATSARTTPRTRTASRTRTAAPIPTTTRTASPT